MENKYVYLDSHPAISPAEPRLGQRASVPLELDVQRPEWKALPRCYLLALLWRP